MKQVGAEHLIEGLGNLMWGLSECVLGDISSNKLGSVCIA